MGQDDSFDRRLGELTLPVEPHQEFEIEFSPLSREVTRDGVTVWVNIYRVPEVDERWAVEVVDQSKASAVWPELFDSDEEALLVFGATLEATGIRGLTETFH